MKKLLSILFVLSIITLYSCSISGHKAQSWHPHQAKKPSGRR